jgi:phosphatidylinositol alpha-1,6-mannosyltransferase
MLNKTLVISEIFPPIHGGSGRWLYELYRRLPKDEYLIAAGATFGDKEFDAFSDLNIVRLPLTSDAWGLISIDGILYYAKNFFIIRNLISRYSIKKIHCGRCLPEGLIGLLFKKIKNIPYICFVHGEDIETAATSKELRYIVKDVLKNSFALIANSKNTEQLLINQWNISSNKVHVLHPGMDSSRFIPAENNINVREELGWYNRPVILTVGRLQKRKGQDMLLKAIPIIVEKYPNVLYAIIGDGEEKQNLLSIIDHLSIQNHVQFMSNVSDEKMIHCYQQCTLFILPNRTVDKDIEGFGMVLAEAQSCGKAVLAGNSGGTAETMVIGKTGYVVDCTDPTPLANKVIKMLSSSERLRKMGEQARQHAITHLDWDIHVKKALSVFQSL